MMTRINVKELLHCTDSVENSHLLLKSHGQTPGATPGRGKDGTPICVAVKVSFMIATPSYCVGGLYRSGMKYLKFLHNHYITIALICLSVLEWYYFGDPI